MSNIANMAAVFLSHRSTWFQTSPAGGTSSSRPARAVAHNGGVRPRSLIACLACTVALGVAGCGGSGDDGTASPPADTANPATAEATAEATADATTTAAAPDLRGVAIAVRRDPG